MSDTKEKNNTFKWVIQAFTILFTIAIIAFIIYGIKEGIFSSNKEMLQYIKKMGYIAPLLFIFIQIVQVIFPVIPGGASCLAGVIAFGPIEGFIYNYIGLCLGSAIAFLLSRKYGMKLIQKLFKPETTEKYMQYIKEHKFHKIFFWGIFLPGAPDDLLCYIAGITNMSFKTFIIIIILGKPLALLGYSFGIGILPFFT
ncbi:MAG: TVP38/TMEM64 family protein [Bacilli bacterium]|nr:TVP38/TMEM64 family protein [Bacilli bacterium]